jgi:hypothetical protein
VQCFELTKYNPDRDAFGHANRPSLPVPYLCINGVPNHCATCFTIGHTFGWAFREPFSSANRSADSSPDRGAVGHANRPSLPVPYLCINGVPNHCATCFTIGHAFGWAFREPFSSANRSADSNPDRGAVGHANSSLPVTYLRINGVPNRCAISFTIGHAFGWAFREAHGRPDDANDGAFREPFSSANRSADSDRHADGRSSAATACKCCCT